MTKRIFFLSLFLFIFLSLVLYSPVWRAFFVSDDFDWLMRARDLPAASYFLKNVNGSLENGVYRPLTSLSFWINYQLHGLNPLPYHLTNIFFLAGAAGLIFVLLKQLRASNFLAFFGGLFFVIIPSHPEAVSWISGRGDVLATFFYLLSLIFYIHFCQTKKTWIFFVSLFGFALALLSKEIAMSLPFVILSYELIWHCPKEKYWFKIKEIFWRVAAFFLFLIGYFLARWLTTKIFFGFYASSHLKFDFWHYLNNLWATFFADFLTGQARFWFFSKIIWPHQIILSLFLFFIIFFIFKKLKKNRHLFIFFICFFVFSAAPILSLSYLKTTDEGDRFAYLPSVAVAILSALVFSFLRDVLQKRYQKILFFTGLVFLLAYLSGILVIKNFQWREAGELSQSLLDDFGQKVDLAQKQGIVILGLPDNLSGAQVWRNGWHKALDFYYPNYQQDLLVVKIGFSVKQNGSKLLLISWEKTEQGFLARGPRDFFVGAPLESLDYKMSKNIESSLVEFIFTPEFFENLKTKPLIFLTATGWDFKILERKEKIMEKSLK